jgi:hypothetical protein
MSRTDDPTAKAEEAAKAAADKVRQTAEAVWNTAKDKFSDLETLERYARENPIRGMLMAFGLGFILALFMRK